MVNANKLLFLIIITLSTYAQQSYVFGHVGLCVCICMYYCSEFLSLINESPGVEASFGS